MKRFVVIFIVAGISACSTTEFDKAAIFDGSITAASVDKFISKYSDVKVRKVKLTSGGGDVASALRLAGWIRDRGLDVEVFGICASSCANYLFTSGRLKTIIPPAVIVWHGSVLQKNIREKQISIANKLNAETYSAVKVDKINGTGLLTDRDKVYYESVKYITDEQAKFFKRIKVSEYLTRAGQEPNQLGSEWTIGISEMALFGVCNVKGATDYGSDDYLRKWDVTFTNMPVVKLLRINDAILSMLRREIDSAELEINDCKTA